jgi:hypothetical protein
MQTWEYLLVHMDVGARSSLDQGNVAGRLNDLGREGWELTGIISDEYGRYAKFIFKRPRT